MLQSPKRGFLFYFLLLRQPADTPLNNPLLRESPLQYLLFTVGLDEDRREESSGLDVCKLSLNARMLVGSGVVTVVMCCSEP